MVSPRLEALFCPRILMRRSKFCRSGAVTQNLHEWNRFTTEIFICGNCPKANGAESQFYPNKLVIKVELWLFFSFPFFPSDGLFSLIKLFNQLHRQRQSCHQAEQVSHFREDIFSQRPTCEDDVPHFTCQTTEWRGNSATHPRADWLLRVLGAFPIGPVG